MIKKKPLPKRAATQQTEKAKNVSCTNANKSKPKKTKQSCAKSTVKRITIAASSKVTSSSNTDDDSDASVQSKKRSKFAIADKNKSPFLPGSDLVVRKRMASLNASAMLAASYEVERHFDQCDSMYNSSSAAESESEPPSSPKKLKNIKNETDETKEVC